MKNLLFAALLFLPVVALGQEPDGLKLPPGFHASVVADGLMGARHIAVRGNGDIYVSTNTPRNAPAPLGIYAVRPGAPAQVIRFSTVTGGTGIRIHDGALYAATGPTIWRFGFNGNELVPSAPPQAIVEGMPNENGRNRVMAFDTGGNMFVALSGTGNNVCAIGGSKGTVGMQPCPELKDRAGIWRWSADRAGQRAAEGELIATGNRNMTAFEYSPRHNALFGIFHERDFTGELWPQFVTPAQELAIGESLYRIGKGTDFGWPYSYWDGVRNIRLVAPEYGGDGKTTTPAGKYASPILSFPGDKGRGAPVSMVFYNATQFPAQWRGGLFLTRHGGIGDPRPGGYAGYDILFVPMDAQGRPGKPVTFADGFAGPTDDDKVIARAAHRPNGLAIGPDGALFVVDSKAGRLWRIAYTGQ